MLATTATANARVAADVAEQLAVSASTAPGSGRRRSSVGRWCCAAPSTASRCTWAWSGCPTSRAGWPGWPTTWPGPPGSGIVYCLTVAATEQVADHLRSRGLTVAAYSGQTDPTERAQAEDDLLAGRVKALVATSALGMGFDKPDLGVRRPPRGAAVADRLLPAGRPRRPRRRAAPRWCCCPAPRTCDIWNYFGSLGFPRRVRRPGDPGGAGRRPAGRCRCPPWNRGSSLRRSRLEMMLKVLDVDGAVRRVHRRLDRHRASRGPTTPIGTPGSRAARDVEQRAMLEYISTARLPDELPAASSSTTRRPEPAGAATTAAG